jgi:uncharacterized membrane protein
MDQQTSSVQPGTPRQSLSPFNMPRAYQRRQPVPKQQYRTDGTYRTEQLAKALGWFSIGMGLAGLLAPRAMSRAMGIPDKPMLFRAIGAREIACGVGILSQREPAPWLWSRVAGDAMDLALLGAAARSPTANRNRLAMATAAVAGLTVLDTMSSVQRSDIDTSRAIEMITGPIQLQKSVTINHPVEEVYRFWHDFENFPRFMKHVETVQPVGPNRWHWKAKAPVGSSVEWDAEVTEDLPNKMIAWRSVEGADVDNAGTVNFIPAPGGRGTIVRVQMHYKPPGGKAGALIAKLLGENPEQQLDEDLRRFKQLIETGEIPTTIGQPAGRRGIVTRLLFRKGAPG